MSSRFTFEGLEELKAALRKLPTQLTVDAGHIVEGAAESAASDVRSGYSAHRRTGSLQDKVKVTHRSTTIAASSTLTSGDKEALIFEVGSQARHTRIGANRGSMPPGNVFFPAVRRARRRMFDGLKSLVTKAGFVVSGDGG